MDFHLFLGSRAATIFTLFGSVCYMVYRKITDQEKKTIDSPPSSPSSSSSSSSSSSPWPLSLPLTSSSRSWEHDVFPSFHGPDVRKQFLSHVLKEFESKGIIPFIDNEIRRGESIGPELKRAIKESKIAIVLLSKNYASSAWCLDELVEIMNLVSGQTVLTIFHDVDPTDVKKQTGDFGKVFKKTCRGKTKEKIEKWRKALESVAKIAGYHSTNWVNEAVMIENIACEISRVLNHLAPSPDGDCLIGMGTHMEKMKLFLRLDLDEVRMVGIWGPPGIGKSTIARYLFHQFSNNFRLKAIMVNIKGSYPRLCLDEGNAQLELQTKMLSEMFNHKDIMITHLGVAQERLKDKKVLLILDDVDRLAQLDALAKNVRWFGPGSRIIVTTENLKLLKAHGINHIYKVEFPTNDDAREMFCMYVFDQKTPKDGFMDLSREVTYLAGSLPLGLKVMGSHFRGLSKEEWERLLPNLWSYLDGEIETVLKFSYDALCVEDKNLFLHIACLFNGERIKRVEELLANNFSDVRQRLKVLVEKSLITIIDEPFSTVVMHSLLVQLGKEIVRKSVQRPFLVNDKDICEVLNQPTIITPRVKGITSKDTPTWYKLNGNERAFEGLLDLQFLIFQGVDNEYSNMASFSECLKYISPKLQLLDWPYSPITCLPFSVNLEFFVELNMPHSKLEKLWEGIKVLRNLKRIGLRYSENLKELPNLSTATNLQYLDLSSCSSLVKLPSSIGNATNLQSLNLRNCVSLVELSSSLGDATNLQKLDLYGCSNLVELPSSIGNLINLEDLNLWHCVSLVELPSSIGNLINLEKLSLSDCSSLVKLPSSIGNAANLQHLDLSFCTRLVELPPSIGNATNLQSLNLWNCISLVELPSSIGNLINLQSLNLWDCVSVVELPSSIGNAINLQELNLSHCSSLVELPSSIRNLINLEKLSLSDCSSMVELSPWVKGCARLRRLELYGMENLVSLPQLPDSLRELDAHSCKSLEVLDCSLPNPCIHLDFGNCFKLNEEARDVIIQTSTSGFSILAGGEVPACFTYRAHGSSVTVELNEKPLRTTTKFKACLLFTGKDEYVESIWCSVVCYITSKQNDRTLSEWSKHIEYPMLTNNQYIFDLEAKEVTSTELVFEFHIDVENGEDIPYGIKECGILQLLELQK